MTPGRRAPPARRRPEVCGTATSSSAVPLCSGRSRQDRPARRPRAGGLHQNANKGVRLAAPFVLGARGMSAARLGLPTVAVYQTDLATYARTYLGAAPR